MQNQAVAAATPKLLKEAFTLAQGAESELEDEGEGDYFAIRVQSSRRRRCQHWPRSVRRPRSLPSAGDARSAERPRRPDRPAGQEGRKAWNPRPPRRTCRSRRCRTSRGRRWCRAGRWARRRSRPCSTPRRAIWSAGRSDKGPGHRRPHRRHPGGRRRGRGAAAVLAAAVQRRAAQDMLSAARAHAAAVVKPEVDLAAAHQALGVAQEETAQSGARPKRGPAL